MFHQATSRNFLVATGLVAISRGDTSALLLYTTRLDSGHFVAHGWVSMHRAWISKMRIFETQLLEWTLACFGFTQPAECYNPSNLKWLGRVLEGHIYPSPRGTKDEYDTNFNDKPSP
jgi:hypothetical protein